MDKKEARLHALRYLFEIADQNSDEDEPFTAEYEGNDGALVCEAFKELATELFQRLTTEQVESLISEKK
jgi:hypothetical protein